MATSTSSRRTTLTYEVIESDDGPGEWRVEAIDSDSEGEVYVAIFAGPHAETRAKEYAAWKSAQ